VKKILFLAKIAFIISIIAWIAWKFDAQKAREIIHSARLEWGVFAFIISALANIFLSLRWKAILKGILPGINVSIWQLYFFNILALFYSIFIPTSIAGEAVRVFKVKSFLNVDYPRSTISVALDRILGAATWFLLFLVLPTPFRGNRSWLWFLIIVPFLLYVFRKKIVVGEHRFLDFTRHHPLDVLGAVLFSLAGQFLFIAANYCVFRCFGISISIIATAGLTATTTLAAMVPISLFGVGLREGSLLAFLPLYGASSTQAMLATVFFMILSSTFGYCGGLIELARTGWNFSRLRQQSNELRQTMQAKE
jgi:hypothetical protein